MVIRILVITKIVLEAIICRHCSKCFPCVRSFHPHSNPKKQIFIVPILQSQKLRPGIKSPQVLLERVLQSQENNHIIIAIVLGC